jgi:hypothetical protein
MGQKEEVFLFLDDSFYQHVPEVSHVKKHHSAKGLEADVRLRSVFSQRSGKGCPFSPLSFARRTDVNVTKGENR